MIMVHLSGQKQYKAIHKHVPNCTVEVLTPDFKGNKLSLKKFLMQNQKYLVIMLSALKELVKSKIPGKLRKSLECIKTIFRLWSFNKNRYNGWTWRDF